MDKLTHTEQKWIFKFSQKGKLYIQSPSHRNWEGEGRTTQAPGVAVLRRLVHKGYIATPALGVYEIAPKGTQALKDYFGHGD